MGGDPFKIFKTFFIIGCVIGSLVFVIKLVYEYSLNKDTSSLQFKTFHSDKSALYPSISLCFSDIYKEELKDEEKYKKFLSGCENDEECSWNATYADLEYDAVTLNLIDYVLGEITDYDDDSSKTFVYRKFAEKENVAGKHSVYYGYTGNDRRVYISRRAFHQKCLTFDIPYKEGKKVRYHSILLNNSVFQNKTRPKKFNFDVSFHYPSQIMRQTSKKYTWTNDSSLLNKTCEGGEENNCFSHYGSSYTMRFEVDLVTVLNRRNTGKHPCLQNWTHDDTALKTKISQDIKCQPSHWKLSSTLPKCKTRIQMRTALQKEENPTFPSCRAMERYAFMYTENSGLSSFEQDDKYFEETFDIDWTKNETKEEVVSEIEVHFVGKTFMLVEQSRAMGGLSLFGNMGGYIGIFLGVALMQLPDFLEYINRRFRNFMKINNSNYSYNASEMSLQ